MTDESLTIESEWPRRGCIRLTLPDTKTSGDRYTTNKRLGPLIRSVLDANNDVTQVEVLSWPGQAQQEWILFPTSRTTARTPSTPTNLGKVTGQHKLTEFGTNTSADRTERSPLTGALESSCESELPDVIGYDICDVDFSPIERTIRPTCRLTVGGSPDFQPLRRKQPHPIAALITDLNQRDVPYLFQTIVSLSRHTPDYALSQRLTVYPPEYGLGVEQDVATHFTEGPHTNLSEYYDPYTGIIRSNFDLDSHDFFRIDGTGPDATIEKRHDRGEWAVEQARRILEGKRECHKLYAGYHDTDAALESLYRHRDFYTKIPVDGATLNAFLAFVPDYIEYPPWNAVKYAEPPSLIVRPKQLPATTTPDTETASSATGHDPPLATQGSAEHQFDERFVADYFANRGYTVSRPDTETSDSVPDLVLEKDDMTYFAEVERSNTSRPANVLVNAARAAYYDIPVYFIVEDKSAARTIANILRDPVRSHTESGARLYTQSNALTLQDGGRPLLPETASMAESKWFVVRELGASDVKTRLELRADGRTIASGPADESVIGWDYETDVVSADASIPDGRTRIHLPFLPTKLAYLTGTTLRYQRGNKELAHYGSEEYKPGWDCSDAEGKRKRYEQAFEQFLNHKTIQLEGTELLRDEVISTCLDELYTPQTTRKVPDVKESSRALWKHVERKAKEAEDSGKIKRVRDRTWRWPPGIKSPDIPCVGAEEPALERWL